jgi:hypothetical protein
MLLAFLAIISGITEELLARRRVCFFHLRNAGGASRIVDAAKNGDAEKTTAQCRHRQWVEKLRSFHAPNLPTSGLRSNEEGMNGLISVAESQPRLGKIVCRACLQKIAL